jgi:hypothetical protein
MLRNSNQVLMSPLSQVELPFGKLLFKEVFGVIAHL